MTDAKRYMSDFGNAPKSHEIRGIPTNELAQSWARQSATRQVVDVSAETGATGDPLGDPLSIRAVAAMLGCSAWTVRQRHIPDGLPHFRSGPNGKLIFFRDQVVAWILDRQQKGGTR